MLETSKDLLLVVIAFCILWLTVFICWSMYYVVVMLKNFSKMTTSVREKLELVDSILKLVKDKLEKSSNHVAVIADSVIKLVGFMMEKQGRSRSKKKK
jgi:nitrate reductase assembly molybdenum cofactor insertion protein NarJ